MKTFDNNRRLAGLLLPVFAMRHAHDLGIGDTQAVKDSIDFCKKYHFAVLQILPIHETIGDHSPYSPISSRALAPALLSLTPKDVPGLTNEILEQIAPENWTARLRIGPVKHSCVHSLKMHILLAAYQNFLTSPSSAGFAAAEFSDFKQNNRSWLAAYTLYRLLVREYEGNSHWPDWRPEHQSVEKAEEWLARHHEMEALARLRDGFAFVQWVGFRQWKAVRDYGTEKSVMLMGEVSFGVSKSSVDVWANRDLFDVEWNMGTRPISYFDTNKDSERWGQNWGLPPYRWDNHRASDFTWLRERIQSEKRYFHICRLDHLRGYFRGYMFPWEGGSQHAEFAQLTEEEVLLKTNGRMPRFSPGPDDDEASARLNDAQGREVISVIRDAAEDMYLFAEIMGELPDYMSRALDELRIPGLIFPQLERKPDRSLKDPATYRRLSLAAYANHDHAPLASLYAHFLAQARADPRGIPAVDLDNLLKFAGWTEAPPSELTSELLGRLQKALFDTPCELTNLMVSDLLGVPLRFNLPGTYGAETWNDRLEMPLQDYTRDSIFGPRIALASRLVQESGRSL